MENNNHTQVVGTGLKCDNPKCDWNDTTIGLETFHEWLNKHCPKCGENLLTEEDLQNAKTVIEMSNLLNSMSEEQIESLSKVLTNGQPSLDLPEGPVTVKIETHKKIQVTSIEKTDPSTPTH